ncbi:hypothetical protein IT575_04895 [bacterium]|nr:hypothetical protein [bacterium]
MVMAVMLKSFETDVDGRGALAGLARRMARVNNLYLFAWICALALPLGLQLLVSNVDDVRDYLGEYLGLPTMFFFFVSVYGFTTIFVAYYELSGLRRAGTLDMLRISRLRPAELVSGLFLQLQGLLAPPVVAFLALLGAYAFLVEPQRSAQGGLLLPASLVLGAALSILLNQAILCAILLTGLFRNEAIMALLALLAAGILNLSPMLIFFTSMPWWLYFLAQLALLGLLLWTAQSNLSRLWPAQMLQRKGT